MPSSYATLATNWPLNASHENESRCLGAASGPARPQTVSAVSVVSAPAISAGDEDPALVAIRTSVAATFEEIERSHGSGDYHDGVISRPWTNARAHTTVVERVVLARAVSEVGRRWDLIAAQLPGRSEGSVKSLYEKMHAQSEERYETVAALLMCSRDATLERARFDQQRKASGWGQGFELEFPPAELTSSRHTADWTMYGLCPAGLSVAACGRWAESASCACVPLSELAPYGPEWVLHGSVSEQRFPLLAPLTQTAKSSKLPAGWTMTEHHGPSSTYKWYHGPEGERVRTLRKAWEVHNQPAEYVHKRVLAGAGSSSDCASSECKACGGRKRKHTCGRQQ